MAKKKSDKETEPKKVSTKRFSAFLKNETTHFVIGLISVIFAVYLLLAFTSFFFTGAADQSILDNQQPGELMQTANHVKNYAGARGAQLAEFLINECFGLAAYFIILFLAVVGMKLMKAYQFRIWKWFMSCSILLIWFSITFKMYDWIRMGLDGKPRPLNIQHGMNNLYFERKGEKVIQELICHPYIMKENQESPSTIIHTWHVFSVFI